MHRKRRYLAYIIMALADVAIVVGSYYLACLVYLGEVISLGGLADLSVAARDGGALAIVIAYGVLLSVAFALSRIYGAEYNGIMGFCMARIIVICTVAIVIVTGLLFLFHLDDVSRGTLFVFYVISTILICFKTWLTFRILLMSRRNKRRIQKTLVVGDGQLATQYIKAVKEDTSRLEQIVGYIAISNTPDPETKTGVITDLSTPMGNITELEDLLKDSDIEKVVIALEPEAYSSVGIVMAAADMSGVELELVPFYTDIIPRRPQVDSVHGVTLVNLRSTPLSDLLNSAFKRGADIVVSSVILVGFSWLYVLLAIGVKASSPGPILFKQRRVGKGNKPFNMLKFRSMRVNDESDTAWTTDADPRKTRFGSFIRKFSLDEMPQFFNVFKGEMSIVGPRPEMPHYVVEFREQYPRYMLRHQIRPGITGWAQINGLRGATPIDERITADLWYIEHWSPWLDIKIFSKTLFGGFINSEKII